MSVRSRTTQEIAELQLRLLPGGSLPTGTAKRSDVSRPARPDWQLDERTRSVGRLGVAQAREALRHARSPEPKPTEAARKAS
jgi:hypothetical protein